MENLLKLFELLGNVLPENNTDKNQLLSELIANLLTAAVAQKAIRPEFTPPIPQDCTNYAQEIQKLFYRKQHNHHLSHCQ